MNKFWLGVSTLCVSAIIAAVAAYFSIVGLVALFAASAIPVAIMGGVLEIGKLWASGVLKLNWTNPNYNAMLKTYLCAAVGTLMLITSIGIYGFLSAGHLEQAAPRADLKVQTEQLDLQVQQRNGENERLQQRLGQIDQNIAVFLKNEQASKGLRASKSLQVERDSIQKKLEDNNTQINELQKKLAPLRMQDNAVAAKLGPVKYVAALFGWEDEESAVRLVILILMIGFDPLAVVLMLCGLIMIKEHEEEREQADDSAGEAFEFAPTEALPVATTPPVLQQDALVEADFEAPDPFSLEAQIESYNNQDHPQREDDLEYWQGRMADMLKKPEAEPKASVTLAELADLGVFNEFVEEEETAPADLGFKTPIGDIVVSPDVSSEVIAEAETLWDKVEPEIVEAPAAMGDEEPIEEIVREMDRDTMISILERNPGILNEIEKLVEEDVAQELTDREKLLDLLAKNPAIISDMAEIIASQITKTQQDDSWLK